MNNCFINYIFVNHLKSIIYRNNYLIKYSKRKRTTLYFLNIKIIKKNKE